ncbi:fatty acid desaturase [Rhodoferax ferrireducens]|uniref:Fatty acid desaturase n=1 Tax=Rhodoferax ferrireducens TaxID=192843 RepID=A0ABU2C882_9BURK|nr:fatty acid desaturase family protein [Rhodoferax ferrireducens]MDR7377543.1 fatty acid desaturase [Rhodoferax ferrireducens]
MPTAETSSYSGPNWARTQDDYHLISGAGERAKAAGLVNASWYKCAVPRARMKQLMQREDAQAIRDTVLWYALIIAAGAVLVATWGTAWAWLAFFVYATLYTGPADSRWHEAGHGTAFKTRWMNDVLYQMACFQVLRRPSVWKWSHARHHTDTLVTGRDPEVAVPLPTDLLGTLLGAFSIKSGPRELWRVLRNACGILGEEEKTFVPEMEWPQMVKEARAWVAVYAVLIASAVYFGSWLPLVLFGLLPVMGGTWLYTFFGLTQHAGLPENVLDHRKNCRTVYMNPVFRFLYWNMNYHVEHHMFPMVPFHALPQLHDAIKDDCPPPYQSTVEAYREIIPALFKQAKDPHYYVVRPLPVTAVANE